MHYDPERNNVVEDPAFRLNNTLDKIKLQRYQQPLLQLLFPINPIECCISGLRLVQTSDAKPVSYDETNAGLVNLALVLSYLNKRRGMNYKVYSVLPAPVMWVPTNAQQGQYIQFYFRYQSQLISKLQKKNVVPQNTLGAICYTQATAILVKAFKEHEMLPNKIRLPAWALQIYNDDELSRSKAEYGAMGVEVAPKFRCSFEENDLVEFETEAGW